ncbi:MAG: hypothetical protein Q9220_006216 [cf. Caloplaca sp. 1 TL-2023]
MFKKNMIPPHIGVKCHINDKLSSMDAHNIRLALGGPIPFTARLGSDGKRRIMLNNFSAATQGGNTSILLEDSLQQCVEAQDPRSTQVVAVSAMTSTSLKRNMQRLVEFLEGSPQTVLANLAYTTTARRMHHVFRKAYAVTSIQQLQKTITADLKTSIEPKRTDSSICVAFAFSGQGSQFSGMGLRLYETVTAFRENIRDCDDICIQHGFPSFLNMITDSSLDVTSLPPIQVQLGTVSLQFALAKLWQSWGLEPSVIIGHSLGEYPALCIAGVISTSDMLWLVGKRAKLMSQTCTPGTHAMLAVQMPADTLRDTILDWQFHTTCEVACINGPNASVVSGDVEGITQLSAHLEDNGTKTTFLAVPYAFHSAQMDPIADQFEAVARDIHFAKPNIPVASTLLGSVVTEQGIFNAKYLACQARNAVDFVGALHDCQSKHLIDERSLWIECGSGSSCLGMVRSTLNTPANRCLPSLKRGEDPWATMAKSVGHAYEAGAGVTWFEYEKEYASTLTLLELPSYAFDLDNYWLQYKGDWSIRKGDYPSTEPVQSQYLTPCLQKVAHENFGDGNASITFVSSLAEARLKNLAGGHKVNGHSLCPSSVYADMAFTAASYIHSRMQPGSPVPAMDISDMEIFQPLIAKSNAPSQTISVSAQRQPGSGPVELKFSSSSESSETQDHARCKVHYGDSKQWMTRWAETTNAINEKIKYLHDCVNDGKAHKVLKPMVYRLFKAVVDYDSPYHSLQEVAMECDTHEATAKVKFQTPSDGTFVFSPYWIDSIAQLGGFVLNGDPTALEEDVYLSHGWSSMRIATKLSEKEWYRSYVHMQPTGSRGVLAGDVYMLNEQGSTVAVCAGLKFQRMRRTVLHSHLAARAGDPMINSKATTRRAHEVNSIASAAPDSTGFSMILDAIASEAGVAVDELVDDANLAELGVDSMLTISVLSKLRPLTGLDLPSSLLENYPTVAELKGFFTKDTKTSGSHLVNSKTAIIGHSGSTTSLSTKRSGIPTPTSPSESLDEMDIIISIIAAEVGIDKSEISPSTRFEDLGVDSLLSIAILASIKHDTGRSLVSSFLSDHPTSADVVKALGLSSSSPCATVATSPKLIADTCTTPDIVDLPPATPAPKPAWNLTSTSVLLHGTPSPTTPALFLLPDGSGSAQSYASISISSSLSKIAIYGLDSPFYTCPLDYTLSFSAVASIYVASIRRLQPRGPYLLGGWSLGGIHAFETARQLLEQGEEVLGLFLIDSPCPGTLPPLPAPTFDILDEAGIFAGLKKGGRGVPVATKQHFLKSVQALENWVHVSLDEKLAGRLGKVVVIWGKDGMWEGVSEGDRRKGEKVEVAAAGDQSVGAVAKDWLLGERSDYGACGWDGLTGKEVECHIVDGNHFSVMKVPQVDAVSKIIMEAVGKLI